MPEELETQRKRAFVASGLGWGLDGFDWTMFAYALPAITASLSLSESDGPFVVGGVGGGRRASPSTRTPLGRRPAFTLYFLGSAAAIVAFATIPIDGSFPTYAVSFFLGFFASGQAAGYGSFLAELFPSNMRAARQGLAYNVGRGLAALGPGFIGSRRTRSGWAS